jgi:molecular chaperone DnaJ
MFKLWCYVISPFKIYCKQVRTVDGTSELRIPPGTQPGDVVVLAKQGVPSLNRPSIRGDHLFTIKVSIPKRIR